jgi:hypothetical protein
VNFAEVAATHARRAEISQDPFGYRDLQPRALNVSTPLLAPAALLSVVKGDFAQARPGPGRDRCPRSCQNCASMRSEEPLPRPRTVSLAYPTALLPQETRTHRPITSAVRNPG